MTTSHHRTLSMAKLDPIGLQQNKYAWFSSPMSLQCLKKTSKRRIRADNYRVVHKIQNSLLMTETIAGIRVFPFHFTHLYCRTGTLVPRVGYPKQDINLEVYHNSQKQRRPKRIGDTY